MKDFLLTTKQTTNFRTRPDSEIKFFQAVLEGITNVEKLSYEKILEIGGKYPKTIFTIGGGGKNLKWNEIRKKF